MSQRNSKVKFNDTVGQWASVGVPNYGDWVKMVYMGMGSGKAALLRDTFAISQTIKKVLRIGKPLPGP